MCDNRVNSKLLIYTSHLIVRLFLTNEGRLLWHVICALYQTTCLVYNHLKQSAIILKAWLITAGVLLFPFSEILFLKSSQQQTSRLQSLGNKRTDISVYQTPAITSIIATIFFIVLPIITLNSITRLENICFRKKTMTPPPHLLCQFI